MRKNGSRNGKQRWKCKECGYESMEKETVVKTESKNILVIADTHSPFSLRGYMEFCARTRDKYKCDTVVHIGDEVDAHALSRHVHDPSGMSAGAEFEAAYNDLQKWFKEFPEVSVCIGNHSQRMFSRAKEFGIPYNYLKKYRDIWDAPDTWVWEYNWEINGVLFTHGTNNSGLYPHANLAKKYRQSVVMGHCHTVAGVEWMASHKDLIFGMCVGSGMDKDTYAADYAITFASKPIISCGVITDYGKNPFIVRMEL